MRISIFLLRFRKPDVFQIYSHQHLNIMNGQKMLLNVPSKYLLCTSSGAIPNYRSATPKMLIPVTFKTIYHIRFESSIQQELYYSFQHLNMISICRNNVEKT
jgi:hypothetical protein